MRLESVPLLVFGCMLSLTLTPSVQGQSPQQAYVISAKAGGVSHVEGTVLRSDIHGRTDRLQKNDVVESGEMVETLEGRAEFLLNPGSFLRMGQGARMAFRSTNLDDMAIDLQEGSFIFEIFADDDFSILTKLGNSDVRMTRTGVFRVNVRPDGTSSLSVVKGRAAIGYGVREIRSGRTAIFGGEDVRIEKFNRNAKDQFDSWSQVRARQSAKINSKLQTKALRESMLNSFDRGSWNFHRTLGVWVYDYRSGFWSFLPFGMGWSSPYGYGLGLDLWFLNLPYYVFRPIPQRPTMPTTPAPNPNPAPGTPPGTRGGSDGDGETGPRTSPGKDQPIRNIPEIPAFRRFEINQRISGNDSTTPPVLINRDGGWLPSDRRGLGTGVDSSTVMPGSVVLQSPRGPSNQSQPGIDRQPSGGRGGSGVGESAPIVRDN